jgi:predicted MFS family arabinose efflux permease
LSLVGGAVTVSLTTNAVLLFGLRILQATGYVAFTTAATALISDLAPPERRGSAMALFGTAANVSMTTAPALVNAFLDKIQLNGAFMLSGALAIISLVMALQVGQEQRSENSPFRWVDLLNVAKTLRLPLTAAALFGVAFGAFFQFLPLLTERRGLGPAGLVFTMYGASLILTRLVTAAGRLLDRYNQGWILLIAFLLLTMGLSGFALVNEQFQLFPITFIFAVGAGTLHPMLIAIHVGNVSDNERGRASAVFYFGFDLGIGMGAWIYSPIFQGFGMTGLFLLAAVVSLFGLIPAWSMTRFTQPD